MLEGKREFDFGAWAVGATRFRGMTRYRAGLGIIDG